MTNAARYERFRALHERLGAFVMPNPWDGASAALLKRAGFEALGSSSFAIAAAQGRRDGARAVSLTDAVANAALLANVTDLPVNGDLEDGYGPSPEHCVATVEAAIAAGLAGLGIEDTTANPAQPIHDFDAAVARIRAAAAVAHGRILLTERTDNFLNGRPDLDDTIRRLTAFAEVGADVLYAPALPDMDAIRAVVRAVAPKPVNVLIGPGVPLAELAAAGVRRVSLGGRYTGAPWAVWRRPRRRCGQAISRALFAAPCPVRNSRRYCHQRSWCENMRLAQTPKPDRRISRNAPPSR